MLELSNQSINDIAANLGYKSPASFDRHFKAFTGLTPSLTANGSTECRRTTDTSEPRPAA
ncbi:helix-turn-helix domain-containing protein [Lacticaseibacillus nasuensis]|uniref:helix-turn-helix domain-containing protein n=1 Tax=Lacticaseibacillus nasuensis TaxID=944671 RepID=UPI001CDB321C